MDPKEVHSTHNMRSFSDIQWGCYSCGSCECHHEAALKLPCVKAKNKKAE